MNPEQRFLVIHKYLAVKFFVFFLGTLVRMLVPQRVNVIQCHRTFQDLIFLGSRRYLHGLFRAVLFLLFLGLCFLDHRLNDGVLVGQLILLDRLILRLCRCIFQVNLNRHKRAILLDDFTCAVLIAELSAVFI